MIAWYQDEPQRVGEVFLLTQPDVTRPYLLGRGGNQPDEAGIRLRAARQRVGLLDVTQPLASRLISRVQLRITADPKGGLLGGLLCGLAGGVPPAPASA